MGSFLKPYIPIFFILFTTLAESSQNDGGKPGIQLKVSGGPNLSSLTHENTISSYGPYDKPIITYSGGIAAVRSFRDIYHIEIGLRYSKAGAKTEEFTGTDETANILGKFWFEKELQFIEIPVRFIYQFNTKKVKPLIFIGPNIGLLVDAEQRLASDYELKSWNKNIKEKINKLNLCAEFGAGLTYAMNEKMAVGMTVFYLYGLTNQVKNDSEGEQKTRDFRVFGSLSYSLY
ncbi:PorT family protein [candidate division KSB1 bacterium]|nr:PorT family protein [candidate division KSB1 bacterium]